MLEAHYQGHVAPELSQVSVPTLLAHGENDHIIPVEIARAAAAIRRAELVVLPGAGHVPTLHQPQRVVDPIEQWAGSLSIRG